jgi:hypothetical protein
VEVGGHSQAPNALSSGKEPKLPLECEAGWPQKRSINVWNREISLSLPGFKTQILQSLESQTNYYIFQSPESGIKENKVKAIDKCVLLVS